MTWQVVLLNIGFAVVGIVVVLGVRVLIAFLTTKDYFTKHVRVAEFLGFRERKITVRDGVELNIAEGPGGEVPLLLIPGQGSTWREYSKALPHLIDTYRIVVVDVHGHGRSAWNPADYTAVQIADDFATLIEDVFGAPAVVAGHSSGGLIAGVLAARHPELVRAVLFEDPPFFATEPDRVPRTYVGIDSYPAAMSFLAQDDERDWVCWYLPRSYWQKMFGKLWPVLTKSVIRQRRADPNALPVIRWVTVQINRIWESMSHPYDLRFTRGFVDNSWFEGFNQAETLAAITCPTTFLKAQTRHDRDGTLLAALSEEDLTRVEELLSDNESVHVRSSHDIHFARTKTYAQALIGLARRLPSVQKAG